MATIKKTWDKCWKLFGTVGGNVNWCSHYGKQWRDSSKIVKHRSAIWCSNSTSGTISKGNENTNSKDICTTMFTAAIFKSQGMETSTDIWKDQESMIYIYTHNGALCSHYNWGDPAICYSMVGPWGHYAKWNKLGRERQIPYDLIYMWNLKNKKTKAKTQTHRKRVCHHQTLESGEGRIGRRW